LNETKALALRVEGYSQFLSDSFREKFNYAKTQFDAFDLSQELALARALLTQLVKSVEGQEGKAIPVKEAVALIREIRETIKFASGIADRASIPVAMLVVLQQQVILIIREEVKDDKVVQIVARRLGQVALPRDGREADQFAAAVGNGEVPSPDS
jgi:hypothetical protein